MASGFGTWFYQVFQGSCDTDLTPQRCKGQCFKDAIFLRCLFGLKSYVKPVQNNINSKVLGPVMIM